MTTTVVRNTLEAVNKWEHGLFQTTYQKIDVRLKAQRLSRGGTKIMKLLVLLMAAVGVILAQPTISNVQVDSITHSSFRVGFDTTADFTSAFIQVGTVTGTYTHKSNNIEAVDADNGVLSIGGLAPNTQYFGRVCNSAFTPPTGCSSEFNVTTLAEPSPHPSLPTAPAATITTYNGGSAGVPGTAADTSMPIIDTALIPVASTCSDLASALTTAKGRNGNQNHEVVIPAGTVCGFVEASPFLAKTGTDPTGTGTIVVRTDATLNPEGTRIPLGFEPKTAIFVNNSIPDTQQASDPATCTPRNYFWDTDEAGANKYKICTATNTWTLVSAQPNYTSGSGAPSGACVSGRYYFDTAGSARFSLYYCHRNSVWIRFQPRGDGGYGLAVPERNSAAAVHGYRFVGITIEFLDEQLLRNFPFVQLGSGANRIVLDRCIIRSSDTSGGGPVYLTGTNSAVIDSYIASRPVGSGINGSAGGATLVNYGIGAGPHKFYNNFVKGSNILLFMNDDSAPNQGRDDIYVGRSTFRMDNRTNFSFPEFDGLSWRDHRAPIEAKRGRRIWLDGNIIENFWVAALANGPAILISPRATGMTTFDGSTHGVSDWKISNSIIRSGSGFVQIDGQESASGNVGRSTQLTTRMLIENNLAYNLDGQVWKDDGQTAQAQRGGQVYLQGGGEDFVVRHNTIFDPKGTAPAIITNTGMIEGLRYYNNITWLNHDTPGGQGAGGDGDPDGGIRFPVSTLPDGTTTAGSTAKTKLDKSLVRVPNASYTFSPNIIVGGAAGDTATYQPNYPTGNYWPGDTSTGQNAIKWRSPSHSSVDPIDWLLKTDSPYAAQGASPGSGGTNMGVDIHQLLSAVGDVRNVVVRVGNQNAAFSYLAPDSQACTVWVSTSSTFSSGVITAADAGGDRRRAVNVTGLSSSTLYYYHLFCATTQPTGSFTTLSIGGGGTTLTIKLKPRTGSSVSDAVIDYGATSSLGSSTTPAACSTGCSIDVSATKGQGLYWRVRYRDSGGATISTGSIMVAMP